MSEVTLTPEQEAAIAAIKAKISEADRLIAEATKIADEHKIQFQTDVGPTDNSYEPKGALISIDVDYDDDVEELSGDNCYAGWTASFC